MFYSFTVKEAYLKYIRDACMLNAVISRRDNSVILRQRIDFNAPMQYNCPQIVTEPMQCSCLHPCSTTVRKQWPSRTPNWRRQVKLFTWYTAPARRDRSLAVNNKLPNSSCLILISAHSPIQLHPREIKSGLRVTVGSPTQRLVHCDSPTPDSPTRAQHFPHVLYRNIAKYSIIAIVNNELAWKHRYMYKL